MDKKGIKPGEDIYILTAYDLTRYRITRAFKNENTALQYKEQLKELLWREITIDKVQLIMD